MEALTLSAIQYNFFHKYLDNPSYTKPSGLTNDSPLGLLIKLSGDTRFDVIPRDPDLGDLESIFEKHEALILEYWNAWQLNDPTKDFQLSQEAAVALLVETVRPGTHSFNFLIVHLLTTSHAVRILLPFIPPEHHVTLVREWWLLVIAIFIIKGRPRPDPDNVDRKIGKKSWNYVEQEALTSPYSKDAHYVKGMFMVSNGLERVILLTWIPSSGSDSSDQGSCLHLGRCSCQISCGGSLFCGQLQGLDSLMGSAWLGVLSPFTWPEW